MIRCNPNGLCSWDFQLVGEGHRGSLEFDWIGESGRIEADGVDHRVEKGGMLSGQWTLLHGAQTVATAQKLSVFTRDFEIDGAQGVVTLSAISAFSRSFRVGEFATIAAVHAFTRRSTIETHRGGCDFVTLAFAFWLTVITRRRTSNNSSS